jgi:hypothetical protein
VMVVSLNFLTLICHFPSTMVMNSVKYMADT